MGALPVCLGAAEKGQAASRTSSAVRNCNKLRRQPFWAVTRARPGRARSVTPLAHAPTSLGITVGCHAPVPARHQTRPQQRRSNRQRDPAPLTVVHAEVSHSSPSAGLYQVGFIFLLFPARATVSSHFSSLFYARSMLAIMRTTFSPQSLLRPQMLFQAHHIASTIAGLEFRSTLRAIESSLKPSFSLDR